jgi:hypothetical protein
MSYWKSNSNAMQPLELGDIIIQIPALNDEQYLHELSIIVYIYIYITLWIFYDPSLKGLAWQSHR